MQKRLRFCEIYHYHPDMNPRAMDDGNVLVQYNHPAANVVLEATTTRRWAEIQRNHQDALATHEVLITPLGQNVFDDFGKKALFGRCFMFMDALDPHATICAGVYVYRHAHGAPVAN